MEKFYKIKRTDYKKLTQGLLRMNMMIPSYYYDKGSEDECIRLLDDIQRIAKETEYVRRNKREKLITSFALFMDKKNGVLRIESLAGNVYQTFEIVRI